MTTNIFADFISLILERACCLCGGQLENGEKNLCLNCHWNLPKMKSDGEEIKSLVRASIEVNFACSLYAYNPQSEFKKILRLMKYKQRPNIAYVLGQELGKEIAKCDESSELDLIVPVPLHFFKKIKRGYNQSDWIAKGVGQVLAKKVNSNFFKRMRYTSTQTKKDRSRRIKNVEGAFKLRSRSISQQHILLVDDVITTGATIAAMGDALNEFPEVKVSLATLAVAKD